MPSNLHSLSTLRFATFGQTFALKTPICKYLNLKIIITVLLALFYLSPTFAQTSKEGLYLKDQITRLQTELEEQKQITSTLLETINELTKNQNQLILDFGQSIKLLQQISTRPSALDSQSSFKDAFILNKDGKPIAFIDAGLKLYEYYGGNLVGWVKPDTNEIIRNFDNSVIGVIENDFVLDETGHAIGSIERSENLRWDREKLYSQVQKKPISHYFIRLENPKQFNLSTFRYSDWSTQKLEDILFFSEKKIQKLK